MDLNSIPLEARAEYNGVHYARVARTEREQVASRSCAFGVFDPKGREFGHYYAIDREYYVIDANSHTLVELGNLDLSLEESFIVRPHAMRDGKAFGAIPVASHKRFKTLEAARDYANEVIYRAEQRALKKVSA